MANQLIAVGIEVDTLGMRQGTPSLRALVRLVRHLRQSRPAILQCWLYHANVLGLIAGKIARVPHILWNIRSSNTGLAGYSQLTRRVVRLGASLSRYADLIIVNSKAAEDLHRSWGYFGPKIVVIPNGFDLNLFRPDGTARRSIREKLSLSEDNLLIGLIGRFHPVKDHQVFLSAASSIRLREPGAKFLLAGEGISPENSDLRRMIEEGGLSDCVHLLGPRQDVPQLTAALDIACSSSWSESFSNVVGEAMACGVPCVVTDVGDSAYIVGDTGRVVPARNPQALAAACNELIRMGPAGRKALGERARQRIKENFPLDQIAARYQSLYRQLIESA